MMDRLSTTYAGNKTKTGYPANKLKTSGGHFKIFLEEYNPPRETCNHADQHLVSLCTKKGKDGNRPHAIVPIPPSPAIPEVEDKFVLLSGKPYFTSIVSKSQVVRPFQLGIPRDFSQFLPSSPCQVILSCQNKSWQVTYSGKRGRFEHGWRDFVCDNKLKIGDGCLYELVDSANLKFNVHILRGGIPEIPPEFRYGVHGGSLDNPIMID